MSDPRQAFVDHLHHKRLALGLTQEDIGRRVGVHGNTVGKWESARFWPTVARARLWALMLGVRVVGGALEELFQDRRPPPCGTPQGYHRHKKRRERCPECWAARSAYEVEQAKKRGAQ